MKSLLTAAILALFTLPVSAATLELAVFDNGVLQGSTTSSTGTAILNITTDPNFSTLAVAAAGSPFLPNADLSSTTLNVTTGAIVGFHQLTVDVIQFGVNSPGRTNSIFTVDNLVGIPGASSLSTFVNGASIASLGGTLASHTFAAGTLGATFGPVSASSPLITSDAEQFNIGFFRPGQSAQDTISLTTDVPEASTWLMFMLGAAFIGFGTVKKRRGTYSLT